MKISKSNYIKILGCVAPYPTANDNCSGYLLNIKDERILLDCGFGVCKELSFPGDLENLTIFISHFHKDHYADIFAIAYASYVYHDRGFLNNKIKVYIPKINVGEECYNDYLLVKGIKDCYFDFIEYDDRSSFDLNSIKISFFENYHSVRTYSTKLLFDNKSIVYSADMGFKNHEEFEHFSQNADIMIIESSLLESDDIYNPYHLTASQASTIASNSRIDKLVLTHFWPEYEKNKYLEEARKKINNVLIAEKKDVIYL